MLILFYFYQTKITEKLSKDYLLVIFPTWFDFAVKTNYNLQVSSECCSKKKGISKT